MDPRNLLPPAGTEQRIELSEPLQRNESGGDLESLERGPPLSVPNIVVHSCEDINPVDGWDSPNAATNSLDSAGARKFESTRSRQSLGAAFATSSGEVMTEAGGLQSLTSLMRRSQKVSNRAISHQRMDIAKTEVSFDELAEMRPTSLRRRVLPASTIGWTKNLVVLDQSRLPDYLFTDLSLVDRSGRLLNSFNYNLDDDGQEPKIYYDREPVPSGAKTGFAMLVSKNSHYWELLKTLCKGGMLFAMTEYSHFTFIGSIPAARTNQIMAKDGSATGQKIVWCLPEGSLRSELFLILLCLWLLRLLGASVSAMYDWKAATESGATDLILKGFGPCQDEILQAQADEAAEPKPEERTLRWLDRLGAFVAVTVFQLVGVPGLLRDAHTWLHPWKGLQPYAAFKADEARVYILGFPSRSLYRIEDRPRSEVRYFMSIMQTMTMTVLKIMVRWDTRSMSYLGYNSHGGWPSLLIDLVPGVVTIIINSIGYYRLIFDKRQVKEWLTEQLHSLDPKQQQVAQKLLKKHFGTSYVREVQLARAEGAQQPGETPPRPTSPAMPSAGPGRLNRSRSVSNTDNAGPACIDNQLYANHCAELARELQLLKVGIAFEDEMQKRQINMEEVEKFLWTLRDIAHPGMSTNGQKRGPQDFTWTEASLERKPSKE